MPAFSSPPKLCAPHVPISKSTSAAIRGRRGDAISSVSAALPARTPRLLASALLPLCQSTHKQPGGPPICDESNGPMRTRSLPNLTLNNAWKFHIYHFKLRMFVIRTREMSFLEAQGEGGEERELAPWSSGLWRWRWRATHRTFHHFGSLDRRPSVDYSIAHDGARARHGRRRRRRQRAASSPPAVHRVPANRTCRSIYVAAPKPPMA